MFLLFWKRKNPQIDAFAQQLAASLFSELPPLLLQRMMIEKHKMGAKKKSGKSIERITGEVGGQLRQFAAENRLGLYGKARLHLQFRARLIELGYSMDDARSLDQLLLIQRA